MMRNYPPQSSNLTLFKCLSVIFLKVRNTAEEITFLITLEAFSACDFLLNGSYLVVWNLNMSFEHVEYKRGPLLKDIFPPAICTPTISAHRRRRQIQSFTIWLRNSLITRDKRRLFEFGFGHGIRLPFDSHEISSCSLGKISKWILSFGCGRCWWSS